MFTTWFTTQVMPSLVSTLSGAVVGALIAGWDKISSRLLLAKIGPSIKTIYDIIDPVLDGSITGWKDSDVDQAIALALEIVHDGKLDPEEINQIVRLVSKRWLPQIAAEKVTSGVIGEKELAIAEKVREAVETKTLDAPGLLETLKKTYL